MGDIFRVNCPGCGEEKGSITTHPGIVGIHCSGRGELPYRNSSECIPEVAPDIEGESESDTVSGDDRLNE